MLSIPFTARKPAAPTLAQLQQKRADAVAARDAHSRELAELTQHRIELATAGDDAVAVQAAGAQMATLTDSIALAGSVIANLDAAIAPLERELAERARIERIEAARLTHIAACDRASAAARGVQKSLEHVTEELEQRCATLDAANLALLQAAHAFTKAGGQVPIHQAVQEAVHPFDARTAPFMEQLLREIRQIPARLAAARVSAEGLRRSEVGEQHRKAEFLAAQRAAYEGSHAQIARLAGEKVAREQAEKQSRRAGRS
jgi:hypothetical protein